VPSSPIHPTDAKPGLIAAVAALLAAVAVWALVSASGVVTHAAPATRGATTIPVAARGPVSAAIGRHRAAYRVSGLRLRNPGQRLRARFSPAGATIVSGSERARLGLVGYGRSGALRAVRPVAPRAAGNRVDYRHSNADEWWTNGPAGLEHGFDVRSRPRAGRGPLTLSLAVAGSLRARLVRGGVALTGGGEALRYTGLTATDANGRALRAWMQLRGRRLAIAVDDRNAAYPVRVDPFVQQAELTASDGAGGDALGFSLAMSGDTIAALGPLHANGAGTPRGAVYVFEKPASGWANATERAELTASGGTADETLGSVAISGDAIVAGSPGRTVGANANQGAAYVFVKPAAGWADEHQTAVLTASEGAAGDVLGNTVGISGDTVVAGAPGRNTARGAAYVFEKPAGGWKDEDQTAVLTDAGGAANDNFGQVAISGATIAVGVDRHKVGANGNEGAAFVFVKPATGWHDASQTTNLSASDGAADDQLGRSIGIDGDTVVAGAPGHQVGLAHSGAAYVFEKPFGGWPAKTTQTAELTAADANNNDHLGFAVAVSGDTVVAGSPLHQVGANGDQGAAYVYTKPGLLWKDTNQADELTSADGAAGDLFGAPVAISDHEPVAAANLHDVGANLDQGAVYVFALPAPAPANGGAPSSGVPGGAGAAGGAGPAGSPAATATPPAVTGFRQSAAVWRRGTKLGRITARSRRPVGTTFSFTLDQAAAVQVRFARSAPAHRKRGRKRSVGAGALRLAGHTGANRVHFEGRISRARRLRPGRYTVQITATNGAGQRTSTRSLRFTIVS
jgi:trimeric autotransporter adhesin